MYTFKNLKAILHEMKFPFTELIFQFANFIFFSRRSNAEKNKKFASPEKEKWNWEKTGNRNNT